MRRLIKILILVLILTACSNNDDELISKDDNMNTNNIKGNTQIYDQQDINTNAIKEDNFEDKAPLQLQIKILLIKNKKINLPIMQM